ncbi:MAG: PfkB family carbohydrate kinase [Pseudomonadota bacterium]
MARILGVGIATLDIINVVDGFPAEDSEVRALNQTMARGGNVTNTLVVLSQFDHVCRWGGVLAEDAASHVIRQDLDRFHVAYTDCHIARTGKTPTSYITLNRLNGSRTIVHYRDLPEFRFEDFARLELAGLDWLHFEGRAVADTARMLAHARRVAPQLPRSVEIEKPRDGIEALFADADVLLFSRVYARARGFTQAFPFLSAMRAHAPSAELVCTWGEDGAYGLTPEGRQHHVPAYPQACIVDSIGAGDSFNAGYIHARLHSSDLPQSLAMGCRVAGLKCSQMGFAGLAQRYSV